MPNTPINRTPEEQHLLDSLDAILHSHKLAIVCALFRCITQQPPSSFRRLIYERLGFKSEDYQDLYLAGGMHITNALSDYSDELILSDDEEF